MSMLSKGRYDRYVSETHLLQVVGVKAGPLQLILEIDAGVGVGRGTDDQRVEQVHCCHLQAGKTTMHYG